MLGISFLTTVIFVFYNWKNGLFGRLMSITFILISYGLFTSFNAAQGFFIYLPHLARTGYLVLFTVTPLLYLSLTKGLSQTSLKPKDFLHFIPALFYIINFIPFFILSKEEKINLITNGSFTNFDEGWFLPKYFVLVLAIIQILSYIYLSTAKVFIPSIRNKKLSKEEKIFLYPIYTYLISLIFSPLTSFWASLYGNNPSSPVIITYISCHSIFFMIILYEPKLFLLHKFNSNPTKKKNETYLGEIIIMNKNNLDAETIHVTDLINTYFNEKKPYLKFNFHQNELSNKLNISNYLIRNSLKKSYDISFTDYVNYYRIKHLKESLTKNPTTRKHTMSTLAKSIGFKSTNSLYLAFKKFSKVTPKEFIDQLDNQDTES